ncbi:FAD-binding domain-containing protein [Pseudoalteromonas 'SMAR']|uniref:FAD-binding domain-containing protein n=1 Tax=Pseudoalteromonas 'SMAR' TaxID=3416908 RepID=UPI003AF25895
MINLVWLKRDLRVSDHRPLYEASRNGLPTLVLYVIEPPYWQLADSSARQFQFIASSLLCLAKQLQALSGTLTVRQGDVVEVFNKIHQHIAVAHVFCHQETGNTWTYERDKKVLKWCREQNVAYHEYRQQAVFRGSVDRDQWQQLADRWLFSEPYPSPRISPLLSQHSGLELLEHYPGNDDCWAKSPQRGGLDAAEHTLNSFFEQRINQYLFGISSPVKSPSASSRLSPYLAYGVLSLRQVIQQAAALECDNKRNKSGFLSRLFWHSHFVQKLETEPAYCEHAVHSSLLQMRAAEFDEDKFQRWSTGTTGVPFVDACIRMLINSGWINFRMRAMLMAYASYHLWLDWPKPAARLAALFVDYEPGIHYPQVQMQSGTTGINPFRIYNPVSQGEKYDPDGAFIRRYVPELDHVPDHYIHTPWLYPGLKEDRYYLLPTPPEEAAREAKQRIGDFYKQHVDQSETKRVVKVHASRKRRPRNKKTSNKRDDKQLNLF